MGFQLSQKTKDTLRKKAKEKAKELAIEARERLTQEYLNVIENFYREYEPKYYNRHLNYQWFHNHDEHTLMKSGLGRTFEKYYKNSHGTVYSGGISISTENMYTDYSTSPINVLNSFLNGYHGPASIGIESSIETYKHMLRYKDWLVAEFSERLKL